MRWLDNFTKSREINSNKLWGDSVGQRNLACCSPWGCKKSDLT